MKYLIGLDLGTTSVKACLFDEVGVLIHDVEYEVETVYEQSDWAEQDAIAIEYYARQAVRKLIDESTIEKESILALSFCSAMHSLVAVNDKHVPINKAIIWSDRRAHSELIKIDELDKQNIYERTGTPIHPMTPFSKLLWIKTHQKELFESTTYWMSIKEYIILSWFNVRWVDYSMASATGLLNLNDKAWDKQLLTRLQLNSNQFSTVYPPQTQLPSFIGSVREQLGLSEHTIAVLGAADGQLSSLGVGAIGQGELAVSVGTSGAIREFTSSIRLSSDRASFCYWFDDNYYIVGGPTNNGGVVLQWLKQLIADGMDYEQFLSLAGTIDKGADGLLFLPYINGERAPLWDASARGNFFGLTSYHTKAHMVRAALEGITYNLYHILSSVKKDTKLECIYVNGGLSRSKLWLQLLADLFNTKVYIAHTHHGAAWGACWLALMSLGKRDSYEQLKDTVIYDEAILPNNLSHQQYKEVYNQYIKLLEAIKPLYSV